MRVYRFSLLFLFLLSDIVVAEDEATISTHTITVLAPSSFADVMSEISREYTTNYKATVSVTLDSQAELAQKIEQGESADVFISEHLPTIENLKRQGLVDVYSITPLVKTSIVLVAPKYHILNLRPPLEEESFSASLKDIDKKTILVTGDPDTVPLGEYTRRALEKIGSWESISKVLVKAPSSSAAAYLVAEGQMAGFLYKNDIKKYKQVKIVREMPAELYEPIRYHVMVVAGENMKASRQFVEFLKSKRVKELYADYGFDPSDNP